MMRGLRVAGVDEAGRGPLAGPVVAAAVILKPGRPIKGVADSKVLTPEIRAELNLEIRRRALCFGIGWADPAEIDTLNIRANSRRCKFCTDCSRHNFSWVDEGGSGHLV